MKNILAAVMIACLLASGSSRSADSLAEQRPMVLEALRIAERGELSLADLTRLQEHPLRGWVEAINTRRRIQTIDVGSVRQVLGRNGQQPAMDWLREAWVAELARRQDWANFRLFYRPSDSPALRCADLSARLAAAETNAQWVNDGLALWRTGTSLPATCDPVFRSLESLGHINAEQRWKRIELAAEQGQLVLMRFLAGGLPAPQAALARDYADFIDNPHERSKNWPRDARSRLMAVQGLLRLAKRNPEAAETRLASLGPALGFEEAHEGRVRYEIALWTVASYGIGAATRLNGTPNSAYDDRLHEWRAREAMSRRDDAAALRAIEAMPAAQRNDSRWQYFEARLRERQGQAEAARALYRKAAETATFHGFLAADRLGQPYTLCPLEPSSDATLRQRVATMPGVVRAIELFAVDRPTAATREWTDLIKGLSDDERHVAIELAQQAHWYDRAVFTIGNRPEDLRQYKLRFPMHHETILRREAAKNALDAAWVAAQTRAESAFMVRARSGADARGLMQVLPSTGAMTARRLGLPWTGGDSLYLPETNIVLGTAHLRHELDSWSGLPYVAIAAYNAGPAPVGRWRAARGSFDPDFWIETIPYKETREYVARVLAFSVIYDWRLDGSARPVSDRMLGRFDSRERKTFSCPLPVSS